MEFNDYNDMVRALRTFIQFRLRMVQRMHVTSFAHVQNKCLHIKIHTRMYVILAMLCRSVYIIWIECNTYCWYSNLVLVIMTPSFYAYAYFYFGSSCLQAKTIIVIYFSKFFLSPRATFHCFVEQLVKKIFHIIIIPKHRCTTTLLPIPSWWPLHDPNRDKIQL